MTLTTHHEPTLVHHVDAYPPDEQARIDQIRIKLVKALGKINKYMGDRSVVVQHTFEPVEVTDGEPSSESREEVEYIESLAQSMQLLIAEAGEIGMTVEEFRTAAAASGIELGDEITVQALIYGLDQGKLFSIRHKDERIVALPPSESLDIS